jgi:hypothetical protein
MQSNGTTCDYWSNKQSNGITCNPIEQYAINEETKQWHNVRSHENDPLHIIVYYCHYYVKFKVI